MYYRVEEKVVVAYFTNSSTLNHILQPIFRHELFRLNSKFFMLMDHTQVT
jgi:hypothetical protein